MKLLIFFILFPFFLYSQGSLVVSSGTNIKSINNPIINLYNIDLYNNTGTNDLGTGTIWGFTGNIQQTIYGTYISSLYGLRLNNSYGFAIQSNTTISNRLDMINGDIDLNGYVLEVGTNTTNVGEINWTNGTIIGQLKRWFAPSVNSTQASGIFPIGNNPINRNVIINYTEAPTTGGYITAEYKSGIPTQTDNYSGLPLWSSDGQVVQNYEDAGYFEITPDNYGSSLNGSKYTIKIRGVNINNVNDYTTIRLIKNSGPSHSSWIACGTHSTITGSNSDFTITSTNVTGFSWFNFGGNNNNPLPVELLYFDGYKNVTFNVLKWSTASEHNSSYFEIENSTNGINWYLVGTKQSAGNSNTQINYSFIHMYKLNTYNYYRLKQVDFDGKYKMYGPISIDNTTKSKKVIKYLNLLGQEVDENTKGILFEVYEDGSTNKILR